MSLDGNHITAALAIAESRLQSLRDDEYESVAHGRGTRPDERQMIAAETAVAVFSSLAKALRGD